MPEKKDPMPDGTVLNVADRRGRAEIADPAIFELLNLRLSQQAVDQIRRLEECMLTAEQRLGTFRVG